MKTKEFLGLEKELMIILGIDPGTARVGFGVIKLEEKQKMRVLGYGCIKTKAGQPLANRLAKIHEDLEEIYRRYRPKQLAVEELFFAKNTKTAIKVSHARGVVLFFGHQKKMEIFEYTPLQIKQAVTGYGGATKKQMQIMVSKFLGLKCDPRSDDAADALGTVICHVHHHKVNKIIGKSKG